ncbi:MAG: HRDC domain-containing protein [Desulfatibacillum sp.]|nr:HRDC domain-containing protein [Desulfatibacillum sp.]
MLNTHTAKPIEDPDFILVDNDSALVELARNLEKESRIAVDLEADSMYHYQEKACLLQITSNGLNYIVDPLCNVDMSALAPFLGNPGIEKVFHGADYDVRCLFRDFEITINNLFDTQVAARFLGEPQTGLAPLLEARFGVHLEKKYQKKNWSQRPLPQEMMAYAANDTVYLHELAEMLRQELVEKDRLFWVEEECELLTQVRPMPPNNGPLFLRFRGAGRLDSRTLQILENILIVRDELARKWNRPLFKVLGNTPILEMAQNRPISSNGLVSLHGFSPKQAKMFGHELIRAIKAGLAVPEEELPAYPRTKRMPLNPKAPKRANILKDWRDKKGEELGVETSVVLTNAQIQAMAMNKPSTPEELDACQELRQWQKTVFGQALVDLLKSVP